MTDVYMPNIYINDQTIVIKKNGITYALKDLVKSMPKAIVSDENISREEWEKTIDKLIEINASRDEDSKIFKGSDDKNSKNFMLVMSGQEINFSSDEMRELYESMGVSFEKTGDDIPECVLEMPNISEFKRIADSIHNVTMKSLGAIKDTILGKDCSKVDTAKVSKTQKNMQPKISSECASVNYDNKNIKDKKLYTEIITTGAIAISILLGFCLHKRIKTANKNMYIPNNQIESFIRSRNPKGVLTDLPQDLLSALKNFKADNSKATINKIKQSHPPIQGGAQRKSTFSDRIINYLYDCFFN